MAALSAGYDREAVLHILANLREWDRREIFALRWSDDHDAVANDIERVNGGKWIAWVAGAPAAIIGCCNPWPGFWSPWCFGTDAFSKASLVLTRIGRRVIIPAARESGGRLLECKSLEGHTDAQRWLEKCFAFERVATHTRYGREGETFHTYRLEL